MARISNLKVLHEEQLIIKGVNLALAPGSLHVLMGPNGSGKSTLAYALMGHPSYTIESGSIELNGHALDSIPVHKRAQLGLFLAFQHPHEIGVSVFNFLKQAYQATQQAPVEVDAFRKIMAAAMELLGLDESWAHRNMNEGFSGGEKKKLEMLQLLILNPAWAILDEPDSGLDRDALIIVAQALEHARKKNPAMRILLITHYHRLLEYVSPDAIHILRDGIIVASGKQEILEQLEVHGYAGFDKEWVNVLCS